MLKKWKKIQGLLKAAGEKIDGKFRNNQLYKDYEEFLKENELELALDSLVELIEEPGEKNNDLWWTLNYLRAASEEMELFKTTKYIKELITNLVMDSNPENNEPPEIKAKIQYLGTNENGRITALKSGYRGSLFFGKKGYSAAQEFIDQSIVFPGEEVKVNIQFAFPEAQYGKLSIDEKFEVREGGKVVGFGIIKEILEQRMKKK